MTLSWLQDDLRLTSEWLLDDIQMTSEWLPNDFRMTSGWLQDDFRMTSGWHQVVLRMTSGWLLDNLSMMSGWCQINCQFLYPKPNTYNLVYGAWQCSTVGLVLNLKSSGLGDWNRACLSKILLTVVIGAHKMLWTVSVARYVIPPSSFWPPFVRLCEPNHL